MTWIGMTPEEGASQEIVLQAAEGLVALSFPTALEFCHAKTSLEVQHQQAPLGVLARFGGV